MAHFDLYQTLGVAKDATKDMIKRAFRLKIRAVHPDVNPAASPTASHALVIAYQTLTDSTLRELYDETGQIGLPPDNARGVALSVISSMLRQILTHQQDPLRVDLAAVMRQTLHDNLKAVTEKERLNALAQSRATALKARWRAPALQQDNVIAQLLDHHSTEMERATKMFAKEREEYELALEILSGYEFEREA